MEKGFSTPAPEARTRDPRESRDPPRHLGLGGIPEHQLFEEWILLVLRKPRSRS